MAAPAAAGFNFFFMHPDQQSFPVDPVFDELYARAGGFDKDLDNGELAKVFTAFNKYLDSKYRALGDEITYKFKAIKYEPEELSMNLPFVIDKDILAYNFANFQVLENTLLTEFGFPVANSFDTYFGNKSILPFPALCKGFLTLSNDRQQKMYDKTPLLEFIRDTAYWQGKGKFKQSRIDWTTSQIEFVDNALDDYDDFIMIPVIKYIDLKRYPFVKK